MQLKMTSHNEADANIDELIDKAKECLKRIEYDPDFNVERKWLDKDQ